MSRGGEPGRKQQTRRRTVRKTERTAKAPQRGLSPSLSRRKDRVREAALFVISPDGQMDEAALYSAFAILRSQAPVYWVECPGMRPFWLVSRYADVMAVESRAPPSSLHLDRCCPARRGRPAYGRSPESRTCCVVSFKWTNSSIAPTARSRDPGFPSPKVGNLEALATDLARQFVSRMPRNGKAFDFAREVAVPFPLRLMMHILGLPEADDPLIVKLPMA